jgi:hypothetical protein
VILWRAMDLNTTDENMKYRRQEIKMGLKKFNPK